MVKKEENSPRVVGKSVKRMHRTNVFIRRVTIKGEEKGFEVWNDTRPLGRAENESSSSGNKKREE